MAEPVDIFVKDSSLVPVAVQGVRVNVYDTAGVYITGADTDVDGKAALLLPGAVSPGLNYEVRFYKPGFFFNESLKRIAVLEPLGVGETNQFDTTCINGLISTPSGNPLLCRLVGIFLDAKGLPLKDSLVRFAAKTESGLQVPKVFGDMMLAGESFELRTDNNGRVQIDLPRTAEYFVTFAGESDEVWNIKVPNAGTSNLIDLIHPYPVTLDWDDTAAPGDTISVAIGERKEVPFSVMFSDLIDTRTGLQKWFTLMNSDESIMKLEANYDTSKVYITGIAAGSADVELEPIRDVAPVRWPFTEINFTPLAVTVTP